MDINPTLHTAVLAALEATTNAALDLSPHTRNALAALDGTTICIDCTAPRFAVYLQPGGSGTLRLLGVYEGAVTTRIRGTGSQFVALANSQDPAATLINTAIELEGSSAPLIELQRIFNDMDIDWEAPLVATLGDVAGHELARILRAAFSFGRQAQSSLQRQLQEFTQEEARLTPPRAELEDFYGDVQGLTLQVDRLESRLGRAAGRVTRLLEQVARQRDAG